MHLKIFITILFTLVSIGSMAAVKYEESVLDSCFIEVVYQRMRVTDTLKPKDDYQLHDLTLRAGNKASAFYSAERKTVDSISQRDFSIYATMLMQPSTFSGI